MFRGKIYWIDVIFYTSCARACIYTKDTKLHYNTTRRRVNRMYNNVWKKNGKNVVKSRVKLFFSIQTDATAVRTPLISRHGDRVFSTRRARFDCIHVYRPEWLIYCKSRRVGFSDNARSPRDVQKPARTTATSILVFGRVRSNGDASSSSDRTVWSGPPSNK